MKKTTYFKAIYKMPLKYMDAAKIQDDFGQYILTFFK